MTTNALQKKIIHLDWMREDLIQALYLTVSANESGILFKMTAVLLAYGWEIIEAIAETSTDGYVKDIFIIKNFKSEHSPDGELSDEIVKQMETDLKELINLEDINGYLTKRNINRFRKFTSNDESTTALLPKLVNIYNPETSDFTLIDIRAVDRIGLLFDISSCLYSLKLDIISFTANTCDSFIRDSFLLLTKEGKKVEDSQTIEMIQAELEAII